MAICGELDHRLPASAFHWRRLMFTAIDIPKRVVCAGLSRSRRERLRLLHQNDTLVFLQKTLDGTYG